MKFKRTISGFVAASLAAGMMTSVFADETPTVTLNGGDVTGKPITLTVTGGEAESITWQKSDNGTDGFSDITLNSKVDTDTSYWIKPKTSGDAGKYIRAAVVIGGTTYYSDVKGPLPASKGPKSNDTAPLEGVTANPDSAWVFKPADTEKNVGGKDQTFTLLDTTNADADGLFVFTNDSYGGSAVDTNGSQKFDTESEANIAYKLKTLANGEWTIGWRDGTRTIKFPQSFVETLKNHEWFIEAGNPNGDAPVDYTVTTKLALLSYAEWKEYHAKIGYAYDPNRGDYFALRTPHADSTNCVLRVMRYYSPSGTHIPEKDGWVINADTKYTANDVRPCFYIDGDYFKNYKIDTTTAGDEIKKYITGKYKPSELKASAGYTDSELENLGYNLGLAKVSDVSINKVSTTGKPVTVNYTMGENCVDVTIKWYISDSENGTYSEITLVDGVDEQNAYMIKPGDKNKYLKCAVFPKNSEGTEGAAVWSDVFGPLPASRGAHNNGTGWISTNELADADLLFSPADDTTKSFILLDKTDAATDGLFVIANNTYGGRKNDTDSTNIRFEMKEGNLAYALNNELYANGKWSAYTIGGQHQEEYTFPTSLKNYINEHEWLTDAGHSQSNAPADYITKAYLAVPSYYEWDLYKDKLGYKLSGAQFNWYALRNGSKSGANTVHIIASRINETSGDFQVWAINGAPNGTRDIRPCFYLQPDYFLNNKIDVSTAGAEVKKYIVETYPNYEELKTKAGYSNSELYRLGYNIEGLLTVRNVTISEPATQYDEVKVTYESDSEIDPDMTTYEWYVASSKTGSFTKIDGEDTDTYKIRPKDGGKYLKCVVTPADANESEAAEGESNVVGPLPKSLGPVSVQNEKFEDQPANTPAENIFKVDGFNNEFILLDTEGTGNSKFFVLEKTHYELKAFNPNVTSAKFDPTVEGSLAEYINSNDFFENGWNEYAQHKIPSVVLSYIDAQHTWETEAGYATTDIPYDYKTTCGVSLLSYAEWVKYHTKIGYDDGLKHGWMLRTSRGDISGTANTILFICTDQNAESLTSPSYAGRAMQMPVNQQNYFRTCFWLKDNFFENVKLDVSSMGDNVKAYLAENYTAEQMRAVGYSDAELLEIGFVGDNQILDVTDSDGNAITAENISSITGINYKFHAKDAVTADVVIAFYAEDGKTLVGLQIAEDTSFEKGNNTKTISLDNAVAGAASMKLMLWSSLEVMKPICESYGLPAQTLAYDEYTAQTLNLLTPDEYTFTLENGNKYILLGESNKLFVMDYNSAGAMAFDESGTQKFNTDDTDNIGYKLNNDYLNNLILKDYIENNHTWKTEKGADDGNCKTAYEFNAAVALLSYSEWITYKSRIGSKDGLSGNWWLRTPRGINAEKNHGFVVNMGDGGAIIKQNTEEQALARPVFYLSKDFVKEIKIDTEKSGSALKKIIMNSFSAEELYLAGYSAEELKNIGYSVNTEPTVTSASIKGADKTGLPVTIEYEIDGIYSDVNIEWQSSFMQNGNYSAITRDANIDLNADEYYIKPNDANKYLKCKITPIGIDGTEKASYLTESVGPLPKSLGATGGDLSGALSGITEKTSANNIFSVDGEKFILLNIDENGDVIVLAENSFGEKAYASDGNLKFDPNNENNIAYFLNNDFLSKGIEGYKLPQKIVDNLNYTHKWVCEGGNASSALYADYNVTCPVALLSYTEWKKYHTVIGYNDGSAEGWILRTPRGDMSEIKDCVLMVRAGSIYSESDRGCAGGMPISRKEGIRPVIALDRSFFVNVHADEIGSEVAKKIKAVYSAEELANGNANYQNHELRAMGYEVDGIDEIAKITFDGAPFYVQNQNDAGFTLEMDITGNETQSYTVTYLSDKGENQDIISVTPGEKFTQKYIVDADCGITNVNVKVERDGRTIADKTMQLTIVKEYENQFMEKASRIVMAAHMTSGDGNTDPSELTLMKQIGVQKVRDELFWSSVEREKGVYCFDRTDVPMEAFSGAGLEPRINLTYNNLKYVEIPDGVTDKSKVAPRTYEELSAFCEYAKQIVQHYPEINTVEVWNEPNWYVFWEPEVNMIDYATMVKAVSAAIHEVRPEVKVVSGSLVYGHTGRTDFEDSAGEFLDEGAMNYADGVSMHPYYFPRSVDIMDSVFYKKSNTLFDSYGIVTGRYATETGLPTSDNDSGISEEGQADALAKTFIYSDAAGVKETTWYNFRDKGMNPSNNEHNFGIIKRNFSPKPALVALNQSSRVLNGSVYIGKISFDSDVTGYIYLKNAQPICVIWSKGSGTLNVSMENSYVEDIYGNILSETDTISVDSNIKYVYGVKADLLVQAAKNTYAENYAALTGKLSAPGLVNALDVTKLPAIAQNIKGIGVYLINSYKNGNISAEEMKFGLSKLAKMLEVALWVGEYRGDEINIEAVSEAEIPDAKVNATAVLKMYKEYKNLWEIAESESDCSAKDMAVSALKNISMAVLGWANSLAQAEKEDAGYGVIIYTDKGSYKTSGTMGITVQNTNNSIIDNASVKLYNESESLVSERVISISSKSAANTELEFELTGLSAGKHKWKIVLEKNGETITSRGIYVTVE